MPEPVRWEVTYKRPASYQSERTQEFYATTFEQAASRVYMVIDMIDPYREEPEILKLERVSNG